MEFSRGKVQVLYNYLPGALFSHDYYGSCTVTGLDIERDESISRQAVAETVIDALQQWRDDWRHDGFPELRGAASIEHNYLIGVPTGVRFVPYPDLLQCQRCRRVYSLTDLKKRRHTGRKCIASGCGGSLTQFPFVQAHNCGRMEKPYLNSTPCKVHGYDSIYFDDTGRVATSRWRCRACGGAEIARLRQTPCRCVYSRNSTDTERDRSHMRLYSVTDPAVFRPWVVPFVNFDLTGAVDLSDPEAARAVLGRLWGFFDAPVKSVLESMKGPETSGSTDIESIIKSLEELAPQHPRVLEYRMKQREASAVREKLDQVLQVSSAANNVTITRRMTEHVAILDTLVATSPKAVERRFRNQGDRAAADRMRDAADFASTRLGIHTVKAIEDFPIGLTAIGYTRVSKSTNDSVLNPFPQVEGKTPLYTVTTQTEALYFQLDPARVTTWLIRNGILNGTVPEDSNDAWPWLYRNCPGLGEVRQHPNYHSLGAEAVRTLLHSISHVFLRNIEWSGYSAQSLGEYMLPEGLACVLYANRYTDTKVGGLITLFEQELQRWMESSLQNGEDCVFDPFCSEDGGACVGCLHREYNCPEFNQQLSRSTLFGGQVRQSGPGALSFGNINYGFWA